MDTKDENIGIYQQEMILFKLNLLKIVPLFYGNI